MDVDMDKDMDEDKDIIASLDSRSASPAVFSCAYSRLSTGRGRREKGDQREMLTRR